MTFPVTNTVTQDLYITAKRQLNAARMYAMSVKNASLSGPVAASAILQLVDTLRAAGNAMSIAEAAPNILQIAKDTESDDTLDVQAEWQAVAAQMTALLSWISLNLPKSGDYLLVETLTADGTRNIREFSSASMAGLRDQIDLFTGTMT